MIAWKGCIPPSVSTTTRCPSLLTRSPHLRGEPLSQSSIICVVQLFAPHEPKFKKDTNEVTGESGYAASDEEWMPRLVSFIERAAQQQPAFAFPQPTDLDISNIWPRFLPFTSAFSFAFFLITCCQDISWVMPVNHYGHIILDLGSFC